ncbi:hypothetical protein PLICRDRAFT_642969 [Plicaturopsis crispa FD-325 SS-3]|nr:hypothetical protein PLICRDRAFT_642969 [Plicaturopsis crispa FD-325 SS-3]
MFQNISARRPVINTIQDARSRPASCHPPPTPRTQTPRSILQTRNINQKPVDGRRAMKRAIIDAADASVALAELNKLKALEEKLATTLEAARRPLTFSSPHASPPSRPASALASGSQNPPSPYFNCNVLLHETVPSGSLLLASGDSESTPAVDYSVSFATSFSELNGSRVEPNEMAHGPLLQEGVPARDSRSPSRNVSTSRASHHVASETLSAQYDHQPTRYREPHHVTAPTQHSGYPIYTPASSSSSSTARDPRSPLAGPRPKPKHAKKRRNDPLHPRVSKSPNASDASRVKTEDAPSLLSTTPPQFDDYLMRTPFVMSVPLPVDSEELSELEDDVFGGLRGLPLM